MSKNFESESTSSSINILGPGTLVKGDIKSNGDIRIDGTLVGSINSKGKVVIGETGNVEGEIICQNADFSGFVKGEVSVSELLTLKANAHLTGNIVTNKLSIEPGARFSGSCRMEPDNPSQKDKQQQVNETEKKSTKTTITP
jgi:cytoskeletal protein CcmA (bactofilin family)